MPFCLYNGTHRSACLSFQRTVPRHSLPSELDLQLQIVGDRRTAVALAGGDQVVEFVLIHAYTFFGEFSEPLLGFNRRLVCYWFIVEFFLPV